jgi:hypothetical protein
LCSLGVAIARDDTRVDALAQAEEHPCSGGALGMTGKILLSDDWYRVSRSSLDGSKDVVVHMRLIEILNAYK